MEEDWTRQKKWRREVVDDDYYIALLLQTLKQSSSQPLCLSPTRFLNLLNDFKRSKRV
jgi:hypothetical protein